MKRTREDGSGRLWLDGDFVCYSSKVFASWRVRLDEIRIVGEFTNDRGPFADDYFICFARDSSGWLEASFYAEGRDECLNAMGARLGADLLLQLTGSTDFASRIIWPVHLEDQPMFDFTDKVAKGMWQRVTHFFLPQNLQTLSDAALRELPNAAIENP